MQRRTRVPLLDEALHPRRVLQRPKPPQAAPHVPQRVGGAAQEAVGSSAAGALRAARRSLQAAAGGAGQAAAQRPWRAQRPRRRRSPHRWLRCQAAPAGSGRRAARGEGAMGTRVAAALGGIAGGQPAQRPAAARERGRDDHPDALPSFRASASAGCACARPAARPTRASFAALAAAAVQRHLLAASLRQLEWLRSKQAAAAALRQRPAAGPCGCSRPARNEPRQAPTAEPVCTVAGSAWAQQRP